MRVALQGSGAWVAAAPLARTQEEAHNVSDYAAVDDAGIVASNGRRTEAKVSGLASSVVLIQVRLRTERALYAGIGLDAPPVSCSGGAESFGVEVLPAPEIVLGRSADEAPLHCLGVAR